MRRLNIADMRFAQVKTHNFVIYFHERVKATENCFRSLRAEYRLSPCYRSAWKLHERRAIARARAARARLRSPSGPPADRVLVGGRG